MSQKQRDSKDSGMRCKMNTSPKACLAMRRFCVNSQMKSFCFLMQIMCVVISFRPSHSQEFFPIDFTNCDFNTEPTRPDFVLPRSGDNGFSVKIEGMPEYYESEKSYTVTISSTHPATFRGFALAAVHANNYSLPAGNFKLLNPSSTKKHPSCSNIVTQTTLGKKASVQFVWDSPAPGFGCVQFKAVIIQKGKIWYRNEDKLTQTLCETIDSSSARVAHICCSCGSAQYRMTFYGLWSPQTHPKDYPGYSTHWSNVIGASHNDRYTIWDYGQYATDGVKKVAEWGWPNAVENEIRAQGDSVISVIKTRAQWPAFQPRNIREPPSAMFDVDASRHLVSLLTMLGPSPDWNVGITKESMCTSQCGWINTKSYDLTPWDAGTDSGVSYLSPNSPTNPQDRIRALTSSDDTESPFYDPLGRPIEPVARVVLERISISGDQCGPSPVSNSAPRSTGIDILSSPSVIEPPLTSCLYGEWSEWSQCGVTCGWGIKMRTKSLINKLLPSASCKPSITEKEICKGAAFCDNEDDSTVCLYSEWTKWSDCTAPCGSDALRFRTRELQWPSEPKNCHEPLKEMRFDCNTEPCELDVCEYGTWSDWMPCSTQCGIGQTLRKKFSIQSTEKCESPVMEISKCMASTDCAAPVGFDVPSGCSYSPWTGWMPCPVTCGVGETFRKRVLDFSTPDIHCDEFQMERTKCMTSESCPEIERLDNFGTQHCEYSEWSEWMPCSASCDVGNTLRKRFLKKTNTVANCEELHMETVQCYMPPCSVMIPKEDSLPHATQKSCIYGEWTAWMPCSVTCGRGETLRKRFLKKSLDISQTCDGFEMETNRCTVPGSCEVVVPKHEDVVTDWSSCSVTCGFGEKSRTVIKENCDSEDCKVVEIEECFVDARCPVDCQLSDWSEWSPCQGCEPKSARHHRKVATSTKSFQVRKRERLIKPKLGGAKCGRRKERRKCVCPS
uniref:spondin-1-like n=1 Tax=Styela clava TaxID=7725 RepID=UPI00193A2B6E|nr:spondin-1-like [Styela clava]